MCPQIKKKESTGTGENGYIAFCAFLSATSTNAWYIDSGASSHMTPNGDMLVRKQESEIEHIIAANSEKIPVKCVGSTTIKTADTPIAINKVLHVPGLAANLLSVSKMVENGNSVLLFNKEGCTIRNSENEMLVNVKQTGGIYRLDTKNVCMLAKHKTTDLAP